MQTAPTSPLRRLAAAALASAVLAGCASLPLPTTRALGADAVHALFVDHSVVSRKIASGTVSVS